VGCDTTDQTDRQFLAMDIYSSQLPCSTAGNQYTISKFHPFSSQIAPELPMVTHWGV
ncbi:hypothetical protein P3X46_002646, partial [Hevea brasiliensis]